MYKVFIKSNKVQNMKLMTNLIFFLLLVSINNTYACIRIDLPDRTPDEVLDNSHKLGRTLPQSQITGAIWINGGELGTAVAIDRYTVLTSAHIRGITETNPSNIVFKLSEDARGECKRNEYKIPAQSLHIHPDFNNSGISNAQLRGGENTGYYIKHSESAIFKLDEFDRLTFDAFKEGQASISFLGPDIAIIKLSRPLPENLPFPSFMAPDRSINDEYGIAIGYGEMLYNVQKTGSMRSNSYKKHVISIKVSMDSYAENEILVGKYKGLFINGDESFIPEASMLKTEGCPSVEIAADHFL